MGVHEATAAQLPDGEAPVANRQEHPALGVVVLGWAGDQTEVLVGDLVGVHEAAIALLADRAHRAHGRQEPALGVVVLGWAGDQTEVLVGDLVGVHEAAIALLANGVPFPAAVREEPALGVVVLGRAGD